MQSITLITALAALITSGNAKTIGILLGKDQPITTFLPNNMFAERGDILEFRFHMGWHRIVQASADKPCFPTPGGFYSNDVKASLSSDPFISSTAFQVTVNDTEPIYIYDGMGDNCKDGLVAIVNPKSDKDLADYIAASAKVDTVVSPWDLAVGGQMVTIPRVPADAPTSSTPASESSAQPSTTSTPTIISGATPSANPPVSSSASSSSSCDSSSIQSTTTSDAPISSSTTDCITTTSEPIVSASSSSSSSSIEEVVTATITTDCITTTPGPTTFASLVPTPSNGTIVGTSTPTVPVTAGANKASIGLGFVSLAVAVALIL